MYTIYEIASEDSIYSYIESGCKNEVGYQEIRDAAINYHSSEDLLYLLQTLISDVNGNEVISSYFILCDDEEGVILHW